MHTMQSRRRFLVAASLASAAGLIGAPRMAQAEPTLETTSVRLPVFRKISDCQIPEYISTNLLRSEGFTDIRWVESGSGPDSSDWLAHGEVDFDWNYPTTHARSIEAGVPIKVLAGLHSGCLELIAKEGIESIKDLKGKRVGIFVQTSAPHVLVIMMAAYVGLDPYRDMEWVEDEKVPPVELFLAGKIDAFLGTPPEPQMVRARGAGHTILKTTIDRPWSQYYCCMWAGDTGYVRNYPVATKRVLRAMLKAVDLCASDPDGVARDAVELDFAGDYEYALETMRDVRYDVWREFDPEDTMRFYALRLNEIGILKSTPNEIIAKGTDWSVVNELRRELKG